MSQVVVEELKHPGLLQVIFDRTWQNSPTAARPAKLVVLLCARNSSNSGLVTAAAGVADVREKRQPARRWSGQHGHGSVDFGAAVTHGHRDDSGLQNKGVNILSS
ncbi:hypothetical protein NL676_034770 [Syzygium grande]|nr:hypothetical protein NL676_034770 [Syzygium grande]